LKDKAFSTFLDQTHRLSYRRKMGFRLRQKPVPPNGPSSTTVHQATSERQIAVAPLSLIGVQAVALTK
jgi:hypothetical protein